MQFHESIEAIGIALELGGVLVILVGAVVATLLAARSLLSRQDVPDLYESYRRRLGRSILLGLELLVGADIIRTVAVKPTFESVGVLAIIVVIRTFLSWSLELEISGRWPWQKWAQTDERPAHARKAQASP